MTAESDRTLETFNIDLEMLILSTIISYRSLEEITDLVAPDDFYGEHTRETFKALVAIDARGGKIDLDTVIDQLKSAGRWEHVGGAKLGESLMAMPVDSHVGEYARSVSSLACQRRVTAVCARKASEGRFRVESPKEWVQAVESAIFEETQMRDVRKDPTLISEIIPEVLRNMVRAASGDEVIGQPTGFETLDAQLGGWEPGKMYVLGGRPSMGKSALAGELVVESAKSGNVSIYVSAEMPGVDLAGRMVASRARVDYARMRNGTLDAASYQRATDAADFVSRLPLSIIYRPGATIPEIRRGVRGEISKLRRLRGFEDAPIGLIAVDYIQLLNGERARGELREAEVANLSKRLFWLAGEFNVPVLALAQLNRGLESRADKRPLMSDLRESGAIEQDANTVMFIYRDDVYKPDGMPPDMKAELIVRKNRNGRLGTVPMHFDGPSMRFHEHTTDPNHDYKWGDDA